MFKEKSDTLSPPLPTPELALWIYHRGSNPWQEVYVFECVECLRLIFLFELERLLLSYQNNIYWVYLIRSIPFGMSRIWQNSVCNTKIAQLHLPADSGIIACQAFCPSDSPWQQYWSGPMPSSRLFLTP